eukprot:scaffold10489_cov67-Cylindrotheca_fusiformis.AAC.2
MPMVKEKKQLLSLGPTQLLQRRPNSDDTCRTSNMMLDAWPMLLLLLLLLIPRSPWEKQETNNSTIVPSAVEAVSKGHLRDYSYYS